MAKSSKGKTGKSKIDEAAKEAIEVVDQDVTDIAAPDAPADDIPDDEDGLDMDVIEDNPADAVVDPIAEEAPAAPVANEATSGGFLPLVAGGLVAGAIGYGVATFFPLGLGNSGVEAQLATQADRIDALQAELEGIPPVDFSGVENQIADAETRVQSNMADLLSTIDAADAALDARVVELEKAPNGDGTLSATALAAYQRELDELRAAMAEQQDSVMSAAAQAEADLAAARAEAEQLEQEALAAAEAAASRAALNRVATAVETGAPFGDALADIASADLPAALTSSAATGVATTAQLTSEFPSAARAALATARAEGLSDDAGGLGGFLRSQFDVRSTAPQEGTGPDAVLSRAEAAIKEGRVADALAELQALPEVAGAEMTDWTARATARADVLDAIATLSETLN